MTLNTPNDREACILLPIYLKLNFPESVTLFSREIYLSGRLYLSCDRCDKKRNKSKIL